MHADKKEDQMSMNGSGIEIVYEPVDESNTEVLDITHAEYVDGYKFHLWFSDGKNHVVDFEPFLMNARNPMVTQYRDLQKFQQFRIVYGNLEWNDCEMCFSTEDLYNQDVGVELSVEDRQKLEALARQFEYRE
jgi:hypothetical protein